jgi:hypothetical protein
MIENAGAILSMTDSAVSLSKVLGSALYISDIVKFAIERDDIAFLVRQVRARWHQPINVQ